MGVRDWVSGTNTLYVDGQEVATAYHVYAAGFESGTAALNLGWLNLSPGYFYTGELDELALYNRALGPDEIRSRFFVVRDRLTACGVPVSIMPLGDSITYDQYMGFDNRDDEERIAWRYRLWQLLSNAGYLFDFVGSQWAGYSSRFPDADNEGWPGYSDNDIAANIYNWLELAATSQSPVDVVLLHIGTNDLFDDLPYDVEDILNGIDQYEIDYDRDVTVILARIINRLDNSTLIARTTAFNANIEDMARKRMDPTYPGYVGDISGVRDRLLIVDMEWGAGIDYAIDDTDPYDNGDMIDDLHPNPNGYAKMATVWMYGNGSASAYPFGLAHILPTCAYSSPEITSTPIEQTFMDEYYVYDVNAYGYPAPTFQLTSAPAGMTIDETSGLIDWVPSAGQVGPHAIEVVAANGETPDAVQNFTLQVSPSPILQSGSYLDDGRNPNVL